MGKAAFHFHLQISWSEDQIGSWEELSLGNGPFVWFLQLEWRRSDFSKQVRDLCSAVSQELCELKANIIFLFSPAVLPCHYWEIISFMTPKCIAWRLHATGPPISSAPVSAGCDRPCFFYWFDISEWKGIGEQNSAKGRGLEKERVQCNITVKEGSKQIDSSIKYLQ